MEAKAAGMDRGQLPKLGEFCWRRSWKYLSGGRGADERLPISQNDSGRLQMKVSCWEAVSSTPRLDLSPCRGGNIEYRSPHAKGQGVSEHDRQDLEELCSKTSVSVKRQLWGIWDSYSLVCWRLLINS